MQDMVSHPIFQSAIAPLFAGLVVALILRRFTSQWQGLAVVVGFFVAVALTTGLSFQPLTSTRKIILCSLLLPFSALLLTQLKCLLIWRAAIFSIIMASAAVWVAWPVLGRLAGSELWMTGLIAAIFAAVIGGGMSWLDKADLPHQGGAMLALGMGVGASSMIAASALYGQLAFAISAAVGGLILAIIFEPVFCKPVPEMTGSGFGHLSHFAAAVPLGLIGSAATIYAQLPATALIFLALTPIIAAIPVFKMQNYLLNTACSTLQGLIAAAPAFWLAWNAAGEASY